MITLVKTFIRSNKVKEFKFEDYDKLEEYLVKLSSSHYLIAKYSVYSDDFRELKKEFVDRYNSDYFSIDSITESLSINKLKVGQKRNKNFVRKNYTKEEFLLNKLKKLEKKYGITLIYDDVLEAVSFKLYDSIEIDIYLKNFEAKLCFLNNIDINKIKEIIKLQEKISRSINDKRAFN
jgi:hypothetical protein